MPVKLRAQQITIDLPTESAEIWVHAVMQKVIRDDQGQSQQVIDRTGHVYRSLTEFMMDMHTTVDPITQQEITISGAGAAKIVKELIRSWMQEKFGGTVDESGDLILGGD